MIVRSSVVMTRTLALGLAASLGPNFSRKSFSTVAFTSSAFAHRNEGTAFAALMTAPSPAQPLDALGSAISAICLYSSSGVMLKPTCC